VELEPGIEGLVHVSEMSWTKKNVHPGKIVSTSQEVEVMVLDVDPVKRRISLGLKQCLDNPWQSFIEKHPVDSVLEGEIKNITDFMRKSGLARERSEQRPARSAVGAKVDAKITALDPTSRQISLSIKAREVEEEKKAMSEYGSSDSGASLGDILGAAISRAQK